MWKEESLPFARLRREMMRLFEDILGGGAPPAVDLRETEHALVAECELPGVRAEDVSVELEAGVLTIRGERGGGAEAKGVYRQERPRGPFERRIDLPVEIDADRVEAEFENGILRITLPKAESAKVRKIRVTPKGTP